MNQEQILKPSHKLLTPIDFVTQFTQNKIKVFPAGSHIDWSEYDSYCLPSDSNSNPKYNLPLDIWHAAADKAGIIWFGLNAQTDGDVLAAIDSSGRVSKYDTFLQLRVSINNDRKVFSIGIPWVPSYVTEEAAYRILDMLPTQAKTESIRITGGGVSKDLGDSRYKKIVIQDVDKYAKMTDVIDVRKVPRGDGHIVTFKQKNYPIELRGAYRDTHPELQKIGIWKWQNMIKKKYDPT